MKTVLTNDVALAADFIKKGMTCAFPTETVYGLGANAFDSKAVKQIYEIKVRPKDNPFIVHIAMKKDINLLARDINETAKKIIQDFFPGPIAVILKKNEIIPDEVTAGLDTVAIRMPSLKQTRDFIKECGVPIAAPSANLSGSPSPTSFNHVLNDLHGKVPCILMGNDSHHGIESTVVDCTGDIPVILRPGIITPEQLKQIDNRIKVHKPKGKPKSPGLKYKHYSPAAEVKLMESGNIKKIKNTLNKAYIGINDPDRVFARMKICKNEAEYAKNLFSFFREIDKTGIEIIVAEKIKEEGIGLAVMNRLKKAASRT